jgi:hypothetical protein
MLFGDLWVRKRRFEKLVVWLMRNAIHLSTFVDFYKAKIRHFFKQIVIFKNFFEQIEKSPALLCYAMLCLIWNNAIRKICLVWNNAIRKICPSYSFG